VPYQELASEWQIGAISGGVMFSPVEEIYDRYDPFFTDTEEYRRSRSAVHRYLLELASQDRIFAYFFVWNDFVRIPEGFKGIKWHRHAGEPVYAYDSPQCEAVVEEICAKRLPIVLEEEFGNTLRFLKRISGRTVVIIPHMGGLNGGYPRLKSAGVFAEKTVWVDTALAASWEIADFASSYGTERIIFGSDYPFGSPSHEKLKVESLFSGSDLEALLSANLLSLLGETRESVSEFVE